MLSRCLRSASVALLLLGADALRVSPTRARGLRMTETAVKLSIEEAAAVFGRLADSQHVYKEPIRTAASGFEFSRRATALWPQPFRYCPSPTACASCCLSTTASHHRLSPASHLPPPLSRSNTAIKPKWLIAYTTREPCGEDVSLPTHRTLWSSLLFADGNTCTREHFTTQLSSAEYGAPLGIPKWSVPGKVLVDAKQCAEVPSASALDAAWTFLGGEDVLECDAVVARLSACAQADELHEAVLFSEWRAALCG